MNRKSDYKNIDKWRKTCRKQKNKYYGKTAFAENHHKPWTEEEIDIVMRHEVPDCMISETIGRSMGAIQIRRTVENKKRSVNNG